MRIVFIGAVRFSAMMLEALIQMRANVVGVCTLADAPFNADHIDLTAMASRAGIAVCYTPDINSAESIEWIQKRSPDVVFCFGWSRLIKQPLFNLAPLGVIGYHPAALPANRGRHPLIWALALGLEQTASTFFFMDEGADSGDILSQKQLTIRETDDAGSLYERITEVAMAQLKEFVPALKNGRYTRASQVGALTNYWRKRSRIDGQIDWRMPARSIHNLVRALCHPYPGAHFMHKGQEIKIWRTEIVSEKRNNLEPGKVLAVAKSDIVIKAGTDAVRLLNIDPTPVLTLGDYL
jgi:methionyl-tRNA formyltransferase